jgi:N-acetylmuramoyl-L-alanine amidase
MPRLIFILLLLFSFSLAIPVAPVFSASANVSTSQEIKEFYNQAKIAINKLESNSKLASSRDNWLICSSKFRKTYLSHPKSEYAPSSLFMLGRIYLRMYERFNLDKDLEESISYYRDCATLFPKHRLADDSLFAVGRIYSEKYLNYKKAAKYFRRIVTWFPRGDMLPAATAQLMDLSRDHNITLPPALLNNDTFKLSNVHPVKYWSSGDYTRIIIKASGPVKYNDTLIENADDPKIQIDFKKSYVDPQHRIPIPISQGLLKKIQTSQFSKDTVRVSLDVETVRTYKIYSLPNPFRVIIDVRGQNRKAKEKQPQAIASNKPNKPLKTPEIPKAISPKEEVKVKPTIAKNKKKKRTIPAPVPPPTVPLVEEEISMDEDPISLAQQLGLGVKKIVLDPGHGGKDPGAIANGLQEKDIVLKIAKKLKPLLEKNLGCEVIITRDTDDFISLEERTAIANANNADLFVSLHINAHKQANVYGIETYFLNLTSNAEAMRVAARENAVSEHQLSDLQDILSSIMKNSKINESSKLARHVHNSVLSGLKVKDFQNIKNLGVKQAPFYVLIGAEMPAILIEMAFISNKDDAKNLTKEDFLGSLAEEISNGIESYMNSNTASL